MDCEGPIVGSNGLSLLKNQYEIELCQDHGSYYEPENSLLIFDNDAIDGKNERAVITRGLSSYLGKTGEKYKIGNKDKIITSFDRNGKFKYMLFAACGVIYKGPEIDGHGHHFGHKHVFGHGHQFGHGLGYGQISAARVCSSLLRTYSFLWWF